MGLFLGTAQMSAAVAAPVIIAMVIWERLDPSEEIDRKGSFPLDSVFAICSFLASFLVSMMLLSSVLTPILEQHPWFMGLRGSPWGLRLLGGLLIGDRDGAVEAIRFRWCNQGIGDKKTGSNQQKLNDRFFEQLGVSLKSDHDSGLQPCQPIAESGSAGFYQAK